MVVEVTENLKELLENKSGINSSNNNKGKYMPITREQLADLCTKFADKLYYVGGEFPGLKRTEVEDITKHVIQIVKCVQSDNPQDHQNAVRLWNNLTSIPAEAAQKLAYPISILLWRYHRDISITEVDKVFEPFPSEESRPLLLSTNATETILSSIEYNTNSPDCLLRLHMIFANSLCPKEIAKVRSGFIIFLDRLVKILALPSSLGAALTMGHLLDPVHIYHPILFWILTAYGMFVFSTIYLSASVESLDFHKLTRVIVSVGCIISAIICSFPSAELNAIGVERNIGAPPIEAHGSAATGVAYSSSGANYGSNVFLGLTMLIQMWMLLCLYQVAFFQMPDKFTKGVFVFRKVLNFVICIISMYSYIEAGRSLPTIENPYGSYAVSSLKNAGDLSLILIASSRLPWGGIFSRPDSRKLFTYNLITGTGISTVLMKYTYDSMMEKPEIFEGWWLSVLCGLVFAINFHFYAPAGDKLQWLVEDVIGPFLLWPFRKCFPKKPSQSPTVLPITNGTSDYH